MAEIQIHEENFEQEVLQSGKTVLLDFWAPWCGPCRMLAPVLAELAAEQEKTLTVGKVNVDEEAELAAQSGIASIPTLILFRGGVPVAQRIGFLPKSQLELFVKSGEEQE